MLNLSESQESCDGNMAARFPMDFPGVFPEFVAEYLAVN